MNAITTTIKGATEATGLGVTTVYKLIGEGKLETIKVGRRRLVKVDSIKALVGEAA